MEPSRLRRIPLREVLNHAEHRTRELADHLRTDVAATVSELHKLTRPKRKKSPYPSIRSVCNLEERLLHAFERAQQLTADIEACIAAFEERAPDHQHPTKTT